MSNNDTEIVIYQTEDGHAKVDVRFEDETVWLSQQQMADLFNTSRTNIVEHIRNIYDEHELDKTSTCRDFRQVRTEGSREVARSIPFYNLDMIISLGYRVHSRIATQFRRWATEHLKEYLIKGFTMNDEKLKNLGGGDYWHELLEAQGDSVLDNAGRISHEQAVNKALDEYRKYQEKTLSQVEEDYLRTIEKLSQNANEKASEKA